MFSHQEFFFGFCSLKVQIYRIQKLTIVTKESRVNEHFGYLAFSSLSSPLSHGPNEISIHTQDSH